MSSEIERMKAGIKTIFSGIPNVKIITGESPVTWDGKGLPPVGVSCEWQDRNTKQWIAVHIVYSSEWVTVIREDKIADPVEIAIENYGDEARRKFRPAAGIRREEAISAMHDAVAGADQSVTELQAIYQAIAAGKIPGIRLNDDAGSQ